MKMMKVFRSFGCLFEVKILMYWLNWWNWGVVV